MELARGIEVPLIADSVESPEVRYAVGRSGSERKRTCLIFWLSEESDEVGRVVFEGFDAIRCCRGEYMPYPEDRDKNKPSEFHWVFEVENSSWLQQRHAYENGFYKTPMLDDYIHYLFSFHDEFVELIAEGIWFEKVRYEDIDAPLAPDHPFMSLPETLPSEQFVVEGIQCLVRHNPLSDAELISRSKLCSQIPFQYFITLEGTTTPSYAAKLRTIRGKTVTKLRGGLFYEDRYAIEGVAKEPQHRKAFESYVKEIAARRRKMGKTP